MHYASAPPGYRPAGQVYINEQPRQGVSSGMAGLALLATAANTVAWVAGAVWAYNRVRDRASCQTRGR